MESRLETRKSITRSTIAMVLLLMFLGITTVEVLSHEWLMGHQTEWIDFENDQEKEEDPEEKKHDKDKLLTNWSLRLHPSHHLKCNPAIFPVGLSDQIEEVLSPPPDRV